MFHKKDPRGDLGKWAENQTRDWLEGESNKRSDFAYHRYPDARAARGALANQPCDFLVGEKGRKALNLEVKETKERRRLPRAKVSQYGTLLKFHWAGFRTLVLVFRSELNDWTYITATELFVDGEMAKSFPFTEGRSFPTAEAILQSYFHAAS